MPGGQSSKPQTTTTTTTPWSGVQPYITQSLTEAQKLYQNPNNFYQGNTTTPFSAQSQQALDLTEQRAVNGSPLQAAAQGNATGTLNGIYLNSNPYLQNAIDAASSGIVRNYQNAVLPGIQGQFSKGGRYGSGAMQGAVSDAQNNLATSLANVGSTMSYNNYNDERGRQIQTSAMAPQLSGMDFTNLQALTGVGSTYDTKAQADLTDQINRFNYANGGALDDYIARINGTGANKYSSTTQDVYAATSGKNRLAGGLGGALSGAATGSMFGPWGALAGGVIGGVGGAFG